jgi:hypothetical protein
MTPEQATMLLRKADVFRTIAATARMAAKDYVEYRDEAPVGYAISNGELYWGHLVNAAHFEGKAEGVEKAIEMLSAEIGTWAEFPGTP